MTDKKRIAVVGGGSWATAIVKILLNNLESLNWWIREPEIIENLKKYHHNPLYLSSVEFEAEKLVLYNDINEVVKNSDIIFFVVPSTFLTGSLEGLSANAFQGKKIVSAIKGIIPTHNFIVADYFHGEYAIPYEDMAVISGPSHAEEVALEKLTYLTIASLDEKYADLISSFMRGRYIKTSASEDIYGTEYAAILKNIYAIACGICKGVGYGDNFMAVLISNAMQEMERFIEAVHPINRKLNSSVYLGDLLVTAYSQHSRNRTFGNMIGAGYSVKSAQLEMKMIAEGYYAAKCIHEINKQYNIDMPISDAVYNILYDKISPNMEIKLLTEKLS